MNYALTSRTPLSSDEMTAVVIVIERLISQRRCRDDVVDATPAWRFSGRQSEATRFRS